jgi:hypothetical protein
MAMTDSGRPGATEGGKRKRAEMEGGDAGGNRALFAAVEAHTGAAVDGLRLVEEEASTGDRLTAARDLPARRRTSGRQVVTRHAVHDRELTDVHDAQAGHCLIALPPDAVVTSRAALASPLGRWGSVTLSLCTTARPLYYKRFANIFGASISETTMRSN